MLRRISVSGTPYECGFAVGTAMKAAIHRRVKRYLTKAVIARSKSGLLKVHAAVSKKYPRIIEELRGIADGSGADYWDILLLNSPELRGGVTGCTTIAEVRKEYVALTHNEDCGAKEDSVKECALITYTLKGFSYTAFVYAGELAGNAYSWNSYGFFSSVNYLHPLDKRIFLDRIPCYVTARALVEAKTLADALRMLRAAKDASGFHYNLGKGNRILSVEQWRNKISVKEVSGASVHTNYFIHPAFAKGAPAPESTSVRQGRAEELIAQKQKGLKILADRKNAPHAICRSDGEDGITLSTVQFLPLQKKVVVYAPRTLKAEYRFTLD